MISFIKGLIILVTRVCFFFATSSRIALIDAFFTRLSRTCGVVPRLESPLFRLSLVERDFGMTEENGLGKRPTPEKRIAFIRHGRTHMNEYLATNRWGDPSFTDVFPDNLNGEKYRDSPLSAKGIEQAQRLGQLLEGLGIGCQEAQRELSLSHTDTAVLKELDLIVVSPLTRALQTVEIALLPYVRSTVQSKEEIGTQLSFVPVVAHPFASERVYLISDHGKLPGELSKCFGHFVDFQTGFQHMDNLNEDWWFTLGGGKRPVHADDYVEWRPNNENQRYACPGEPYQQFEERMIDLYRWLDNREELNIALVCHWGVLEWLTGEDFANCEVQVIPFRDISTRLEEKML